MNTADLLPPDIMEEDSLLDSAAQLEESARLLDLEDWIVQRLKRPEREITVNLPLRRDLGDAITCAAYRVQHFRGRAGCLGPVLLAPDAHIAVLRPLALHLTLQCALFDLPLGGSAGAIVCDPTQLSETEMRHLVRQYAAALRDLGRDIFASAEYAGAWTTASPQSDSCAVVGKPRAIGGLPDLPSAIAAGWLALIAESLAASRRPVATLRNCRVSLQGFDASAAALGALLHSAGARIIALADRSGGLFDERGLDLSALAAYVARHGMIYGFGGAEAVNNADVLESACDLLITAAAERQINSRNAARIRAPLVLEAVYHAVTPAAQRSLAARGILVIPDLLGAAPATLAWFAEWQHGIRYSVPAQANIESVIRDTISDAFHHAQIACGMRGLPFADACRILALEKLGANLRLTG